MMQRAPGVGDSEDLEEHELLEAIARRDGTPVVLRVWAASLHPSWLCAGATGR